MAEVVWKAVKSLHCDHIGEDVALEARVVYPLEILPDQPRILAHRCSHGVSCNSFDRPSCQWAGTLPGFDPLV